MMDIMYFGYEGEDESPKLQAEFIPAIKEKFEDVKLRDAFDDIKGYRQEVHLPDEKKDNYLCWLIGNGWFEMSITMQLMMLDQGQKDEFERIYELTKIQYPEAFKKE